MAEHQISFKMESMPSLQKGVLFMFSSFKMYNLEIKRVPRLKATTPNLVESKKESKLEH